jgi:pimeloyl-ACP methyl ester carboxylesterase
MASELKLKDIVFLPGLNCDGNILFEHQIAKFRELGHNVIVIDNTKAKNSQELIQQITEQVKEPSHFIGLSAGGYALMELLQTKPELVDKAVFLNTQAKADSDERKNNRRNSIARAANGEYQSICEETYPIMVSKEHVKRADLRATYFAMAKNVAPEGYINQTEQVLSRPDFLPTLGNINCKSLIIAGQNDQLFPVENAREIMDGINTGKADPIARLVIIKDCGHLSTLEQPEAVTDQLVKFLSRNIERTSDPLNRG